MRKHKGSPRIRRNVWMGAICLFMTLQLIAMPLMPVATDTFSAQAETKKGSMASPVVAAYVYDKGNLKLRDADAAYITQMNYSFALIKDGKVSGDHWQSIGTFKSYIKKHPNILPVLSVGGWGADGFSQAAASSKGRAVFVSSAVSLMEAHGFLGIDIDWEYPGFSTAGIKSSKNDPENFLLLLKEMRAALNEKTNQDGKKRYLSIAVGGSKEYADKLDCPALGAILDQVNVMTYDLRGFEKITGHHTSLYPQNGDKSKISAATAVEAYAKAGIPKGKLVMGAAFYGRAWRNVNSKGNNGLGKTAGTSGNKSYGYSSILNFIKSGEYTRYWDDYAMAPYLFNGSTFISYEDTESIAAKGKYAMEVGLMGVMFWEYSQDSTGALVKALSTAMN